jgi:small subunit ribosomal protein S15
MKFVAAASMGVAKRGADSGQPDRLGRAAALATEGTRKVQMSVTKERKSELIQEFGRAGSDTGSPEVQISILTTRIAEMTKHLQLHKKDYASRRGLLGMVSRRRRLLDYVKRTDPQMYLDLLRRLDIRK